MRDYPLSGWAQHNHKHFKCGKGRQKLKNQTDGSVRMTMSDIAGFEVGGMGPHTKECR